MSLISESLDKAHQERTKTGTRPSFNLLGNAPSSTEKDSTTLRRISLIALPALAVTGLVYLAMALDDRAVSPVVTTPDIPTQTASIKVPTANTPEKMPPTLGNDPVPEENMESTGSEKEEPAQQIQVSTFKTASVESRPKTTSWMDNTSEEDSLFQPDEETTVSTTTIMASAPVPPAPVAPSSVPEKPRVQVSVKRNTTFAKESTKGSSSSKKMASKPASMGKATDPSPFQKPEGRQSEQTLFQDARFYFKMGVFYQQTGDHIEALDFYNKALQLDPSNAEIYNNRSLIYKELGKNDKAVEGFLQAIHLNPKYVKAYNNIGLIYYMKGNSRAAISNFRKAIQIDPRNLESHNNLAIVYKKQNRLDDARGLYQTILKQNPKHAEAHYNLALIYEQEGDYPNAILHYQQFSTLAKNARPGLVSRVNTHLKTLQ